MINQLNLNNEDIYSIFDFINIGIYWKDRNGYIVGCNKYILDLFNLHSRKDILGKNQYNIFNHKDVNRINEIDTIVFNECYYQGKEYFELNNQEKYLHINQTQLLNNNNNIVGFFSTLIDITAQTEISFNYENKIKQIINSVNGSIYWKDTDERYLGCNKYVLDMARVDNDTEIIGKTDYDLLWKNEADKINKADKQVIENGNYQGEEYATLSDGEQRIYLSSKNRLLDNYNNTIGIIGTSIDITAEKQLNKLKEEKQNAIIEEQNKVKKIVGQMIHDIQSPLSSLRIILQIANNIPEKERGILKDAATSIADITNHMLNRYKNKEDVEVVPQEPKQEMLASVELTQISSQKRYEYQNVRFNSNFAENSNFTFIAVQPNAFRRMMSNLINNAVDAIEDVANGRVDVNLYLEDNFKSNAKWLSISVTDNGKGMSNELVAKIKNGIAVTEDKTNGHGIGFTQIRDTVQNNDAELNIFSSLGSGTSIIIRILVVTTPNWIAEEIKIVKDDIIVLDDDPSIHGAWDTKFKDILDKMPTITFKHFTHGLR